MPNWNEVKTEINRLQAAMNASPSAMDVIRREYLRQLHENTGRNVITYYSGFLQCPSTKAPIQIYDGDINAFMNAINKLDTKLGLDLILHTPGGSLQAANAIIGYLRRKFGTDIRCFVPQLAMSAGTMMACACKCIFMGKQSSIGPFDPQLGPLSCGSVLAEFRKASDEIRTHKSKIPIWQAIYQKLPPGVIVQCQNAMDMTRQLVTEWLTTGMFEGEADAADKANKIVDYLNDAQRTFMHDNHISIEQARELGLKVEDLEKDQVLQDLVLTVHHAYMETFNQVPILKAVENHNGVGTFLKDAR